MTTHQTIEDLVNQKFDPISQKIDVLFKFVQHKCRFNNEAINKMLELLKNSNNERIEYGALFYFDNVNKEIIIGQICIGNKQCINLEENINRHETYKKIGSYHTHPYPKSKKVDASLTDLAKTIKHYKISCIGEGDKIKCFIPRDKDKFIKEEEYDTKNLLKFLLIEKNSSPVYEDFIKYIYYLDYIEKRYFITFELYPLKDNEI